jgi:hypothetical protein
MFWWFFTLFGSVEEVEDVLDLEELRAKIVVDDYKSEDIAAIYQNNEPVEQSHGGEGALKRSHSLFLHRSSYICEDPCE